MSTGIGRQLLDELVDDGLASNPLSVLGLSHELLRVGLTEEELLSVTRRFARSLLSEVHEDRVQRTPRTEALQRRFSAAMGCLRDRASFDAALGELRREASRVRDQINSDVRRDRALTSRLALAIRSLETIGSDYRALQSGFKELRSRTLILGQSFRDRIASYEQRAATSEFTQRNVVRRRLATQFKAVRKMRAAAGLDRVRLRKAIKQHGVATERLNAERKRLRLTAIKQHRAAINKLNAKLERLRLCRLPDGPAEGHVVSP